MNIPPILRGPCMPACVCALALAVIAGHASAQSAYPSKSIRILVPFPAGGSTDFVARGIGQKITEAWGQQVVLDNRAGAAGIVATEIVAKAAPDGYTLLMNSVSHAANASMYSKLPYDTLRDFAPIILFADVPIILVVRSQFSANSVADLISLARAKPGQLNFAAGGVGASSHLAGELFRSMARIQWQTVQYKGGAPTLVDLLGGQVDLTFSPIASSIQHVKAGRLKALGVTSSKRVASAAGFADDRRIRGAWLCGQRVVWRGGARARPAGHHSETQPRDQCSAEEPGVSRGYARPRRRADRGQQRGVRRVHAAGSQ